MIRAYANGIWFTAEPATDECKGCAFDKERTSVCKAACAAATAAGLPDCVGPRDVSLFIYSPDPSNGRQLDILIDAPAP